MDPEQTNSFQKDTPLLAIFQNAGQSFETQKTGRNTSSTFYEVSLHLIYLEIAQNNKNQNVPEKLL